MSRAFGLVLVLAALAVGAYLFTVQSRKEGTTGNRVTQAEAQASSAAAGTNFQAAAQVLQGWYAANGTYAGATLPPGSGVVVARADLMLDRGARGGLEAVAGRVGPGGTPQAGPC